MKQKLNTIIIDDHPILAEGLKLFLINNENINFKGVFHNGLSVLEFTDLMDIDLIFLDVFLPDINGIDLCIKIKKTYPKIKVLAFSSQFERSLVLQMLKAGANGYFLKSASLDELNEGINEVAKDEIVFCKEVDEMMSHVNINDANTTPRLTNREKEILLLLKQGKTTQEVSDILFLSFLTVQTHRRNLLNKFQVNNLMELINIADQYGLL
jgi:DNA-binding NarL/FixJ family response regulator